MMMRRSMTGSTAAMEDDGTYEQQGLADAGRRVSTVLDYDLLFDSDDEDDDARPAWGESTESTKSTKSVGSDCFKEDKPLMSSSVGKPVQKEASGTDSAAPLPDDVTTVMIRRTPSRFTQCNLMAFLDLSGFSGTYDFVFVPTDQRMRFSRGFVFVNFNEPLLAQQFHQKFHGQDVPELSTSGSVQVVPADVQGFSENARAYTSACENGPCGLFQPVFLRPFPPDLAERLNQVTGRDDEVAKVSKPAQSKAPKIKHIKSDPPVATHQACRAPPGLPMPIRRTLTSPLMWPTRSLGLDTRSSGVRQMGGALDNFALDNLVAGPHLATPLAGLTQPISADQPATMATNATWSGLGPCRESQANTASHGSSMLQYCAYCGQRKNAQGPTCVSCGVSSFSPLVRGQDAPPIYRF